MSLNVLLNISSWAVAAGAALVLAGLTYFGARLLADYAARRSRVKPAVRFESSGQHPHELERQEEQRREEQQQESLRRACLQSALSQVMPPELAAEIALGRHTLACEGSRRQVSVVYVELAELSSLAERMPPAQFVALFRELSSIIRELVFRQGGLIERAAGGSLMAVFGALDNAGDHAERALAAAEDIRRFVRATSSIRLHKYGFDVQLSIGVSTGDAVLGGYGGDGFLGYTAIGEVVSTAARLAALARPGQILTTDQLAQYMSNSGGFSLTPVGERLLFGRQAAARLLELS